MGGTLSMCLVVRWATQGQLERQLLVAGAWVFASVVHGDVTQTLIT